MRKEKNRNNIFRLLRIARDMRASDLAEYVGVSRAFINAVENGQRRPSIKLIPRYAEALRVDINTIFYFLNPENHSEDFTTFLMQILERLVELDNSVAP